MRCPSTGDAAEPGRDRKSTRLNSSHTVISYADFCLKKNRAPGDESAGRRAAAVRQELTAALAELAALAPDVSAVTRVRAAAGYLVFFINDAPAKESYTLSLHDALPI